MCVGTCRFATCCSLPHYNGRMTLHGACVGEKAGARNRVFFRVKWLQPAMKGTLCVCVCAAGAAALVSSTNRLSLGVLQRVVVHACVVLCVS